MTADNFPMPVDQLDTARAAPTARQAAAAGLPNSTPNRFLGRTSALRWALGLSLTALIVLCQPWRTAQNCALWDPSIGLGLVLMAWLGGRWLAAAAGVSLLVRLAVADSAFPAVLTVIDVTGWAIELAGAWACYHTLARGSRRLNDPRSASLFLLLVPGAAAGLSGLSRAVLFGAEPFWPAATHYWLTQALGLLTIAPSLLLLGTPLLARVRLIPAAASREDDDWVDLYDRSASGDLIETIGLALGAGILGYLLSGHQLAEPQFVNWHLWGTLLLLVVWASLRQGLRGGSLAALAAAIGALFMAAGAPSLTPQFVALQGNLLALASTSLLVGASSAWIRASEMRYRQVVGHIPVVLYSARVCRAGGLGKPPEAQVLLVSAACREILGCAPADLVGNFESWLQRIHPEDRELVTAALVQMVRQPGPVRCEYRLNSPCVVPQSDTDRTRSVGAVGPQLAVAAGRTTPQERWVRDLFAPSYDSDGNLLGWEGVVEDITTQRTLARDLQHTSTMLQTLVANLPAGVFFVQGPMGLPLLVNSRARQLLGQREDPSVGLTHLPRLYRLHRPDGSIYPWEELPVYKALHMGMTSMRDDIVVHRPDGRQVPLITWAAPIDLGGTGPIEAAVWVFEDLTSLHQAEAARLDSEARLRTIIEAMAEGLIIQDPEGVILECNPAACAILGQTADQLLCQTSLGPDVGWLREDGTPFPAEDHPDVLCRSTRQPVRNAIAGLPIASADGDLAVRWILINCTPLSTGRVGHAGFQQRTIITLADITASRHLLADADPALEMAACLATGFAELSSTADAASNPVD